MALLKVINQGDELIFDLKGKKDTADRISIFLVECAGRSAVMRISADRSIPIDHSKQANVPVRNGIEEKVLNWGDELLFDLSGKRDFVNRISMYFVGKTGRAAVMKVCSDRSIPLKHFRQATTEGGDVKTT